MTPHLIHVGYPKTGSNYLRRWFAAHPEIAFAAGGLAGFRDIYQLAGDAALPGEVPLVRVTSSENLAVPGPGPAAGDQPPGHDLVAAQERACALLQSLFADAHILIVTRGFRTATWSGFSQYVRAGGDPERFALFEPHRSGPASRGGWDYNQLIGLYRRAFGGRVIVLPYELLRDDPDRFLREIEAPFGLSRFPAPAGRANPSLSPEELCWYPRLTRIVRTLPVGERLRGLALRAYLPAMMNRRLHPLVRLLQRIRPLAPLTIDSIPPEAIDRFRGRAESLRGNPLYADYAEDYLL